MEKTFQLWNVTLKWSECDSELGLLLWCHLVDRTWWCISITLLIVFGSCSSSLSLNINEQTRANNLHVKDWVCIQPVLLCRKEREKVRKRNGYKECRRVTNTNTFLGWLNLQSSDISPSFCAVSPIPPPQVYVSLSLPPSCSWFHIPSPSVSSFLLRLIYWRRKRNSWLFILSATEERKEKEGEM